MNIIFTRPLIDSEDLMMNFFSSGHKVIHMPTLSIASANMEPINTKDYDGLIFTSANAARFLKLKNDDKNIKCFCVGNATEKEARGHGFSNTIAAEGNVLNLKELILQNFEKTEGKLVYVSGENISVDLDNQLQNEGYEVKRLINYETVHNEKFDNDFINKLIRERMHWENRITELGGRKYAYHDQDFFKNKVFSLIGKSLAPSGLLFNIIALVTGSIWGKPTWGTFWGWGGGIK